MKRRESRERENQERGDEDYKKSKDSRNRSVIINLNLDERSQAVLLLLILFLCWFWWLEYSGLPRSLPRRARARKRQTKPRHEKSGVLQGKIKCQVKKFRARDSSKGQKRGPTSFLHFTQVPHMIHPTTLFYVYFFPRARSPSSGG